MILGRDYVMGFRRSLTIDLSLSRLVFLAWCLHLRDRGGDVGCNVSSLCGAYLLGGTVKPHVRRTCWHTLRPLKAKA